MNTQPEFSEVCALCGYITRVGCSSSSYVSFTICNGCADSEGEKRQAETAREMQVIELKAKKLADDWLKSQETHVGENYGQ